VADYCAAAYTYPYLPRVAVATTSAKAYMALLGGTGP
jgi:hypothetical protein